MDAASSTGIDDIRAILEKVRFTPLELTTKVYIIDEVHGLSSAAFNGLLKTLEEPPEHVMFILATTEPQRVPATIASRCQRMDFHRLGVEDIVARTREILKNTDATIDDEGLLAIARAADGGMRDALSLADQCIAFCGDNVTAEGVYSVLGSMDGAFMFDIADALIDGDAQSAIALLDKVIDDGRDMRVFAHDLALHMRALLLAKLCGSCTDVLDCTADDMKRYCEQAARCGEVRLLRAVELLLQTQQNLRWLTLPRVLMEGTLVRIARPEEKKTVEDVLERMELIEQKLAKGVVTAPAQPAQKPAPMAAVQTAAPAQTVQPKKEPAAAPNNAAEIWTAARNTLSKTEPAAAVMMLQAKKTAIENGQLEAGFDKAIYFETLNKPRFHNALASAIEEHMPGLKLHLYIMQDDSLEQRAKSLFGDVESVD